MLSEEALILFVAMAALALLVLGVLELLAPSRPRHPRRVGRDPWRRARTASVPPRPMRAVAPAPSRPVEEAEPPIERMLRSEAERDFRRITPAAPAGVWPPRVEPPPAQSGFIRQIEPAPPMPLAPSELQVASEPEPAVEMEPVAAAPAPEPPELEPEPPEPEPEPAWEAEESEPEPVATNEAEPPPAPESPVERCYRLYEAKRFREVVGEAMEALEQGGAEEPDGTARLWGVVGLAHQGLGERDAAYVAFGEAISAAGEPERRTWERYLATLTLEVGRDLIARAESAGLSDGEQRVADIRTAMSWLERGLATVPDDRALRDCVREARDALWPTYEHVALELMQRQDYESARGLLQEATASAECPSDFQATFQELLSGTYSGQVGQLTAEALRSMREGKESEALAALDRAEEMLASIPDDSVPERRRQELERRLWWSYTKVGVRWVEGGTYHQAVAPLLRALRFASVGVERLDETRRPLARALGGLVESRAPVVERLLDGGDREEARKLVEPLWSSMEQALTRGMNADELGEGFARLRALSERLSP
jgi:tetratricopeptide (TPR) repeat protein